MRALQSVYIERFGPSQRRARPYQCFATAEEEHVNIKIHLSDAARALLVLRSA